MFKKIIPLILASSIVFTCIAPASAADAPTQGEVVNEIVQSSMAGVIVNLAVTAGTTAIGAYFGQPQVGAFLGPVVADGILDYSDYIAAGFTEQEIYDQFTNYNAQLESDLGTATLIDGGVRIFFECSSITGYHADLDGIVLGVNPSVTYRRSSEDLGPSVMFSFVDRVAPFSGRYVRHYEFFRSSSIVYANPGYSDGSGGNVAQNGTIAAGPISAGLQIYTYEWVSLRCRYYIDLIPDSGSVPTSVDISTSSRPTTFVTPVAIQNPDETYTVYNNITLVDEGNKVVFDPTTGESLTFTDWAYDYESRTYDLTLDGGGNMTVQFGNDSITMTQGDTVTNIFYVQDPADDPGADNPDDPDNPGTDEDVSGFFTWWKNAWNGFVDRLFTVLDGGDLEVILPGEEGNPEDEEDSGWTVFDLFALIRDALWKIITGVITVVLDGFLGLVDAIASLGDFFDIYDPANPDGIFGVPGGGVELWS